MPDEPKKSKRAGPGKKQGDLKLDLSGGTSPQRTRSLIAYVLLTFLVLWIWQTTVTTMAVRTISYSAFKTHLAEGEVVSCSVEAEEIRGEIKPKPDVAPQGKDTQEQPTEAATGFRFFHLGDVPP